MEEPARRRLTVLEGLQGNVLRGYGTSAVLYLFTRVLDPDRARLWLDSERLRITTTEAGKSSVRTPLSTRPSHTTASSASGSTSCGSATWGCSEKGCTRAT